MASITKHDKAQDAQADEKVFRLEDFPVHEKLEKFMEDVKWVASDIYDFLLYQSLWLVPFLRYGIYPLTAFAMAVPPPSKAEPSTPELHRYFVAQVLKREMWLTDHYLVRTCRSDSEKANEPEPQDEESRRVNTMQVCLSNSLKLEQKIRLVLTHHSLVNYLDQ